MEAGRADAGPNARFAHALVCAAASVLPPMQRRHVVVSPGSRSTPLALAFAACPQMHLHSVVDERVAGFMALGLARASGRATVLLCTSGSAPAHYLPSVIEAFHSGIPLVVISADRPWEAHGCGGAQTTTQTSLFAAHAHFIAALGCPDAATSPRVWGAQMAVALHHAEVAPFGPVHLNAPFREPLYEPHGRLPSASPQAPLQVVAAAPALTAQDAAAVAQRLLRAQRGVVVLGPQQAQQAAAPMVLLAKRLGWPVIAEPAAGTQGDVHCADAILRAPSMAAHLAADFVLRVGSTPTSQVVQTYMRKTPSEAVLWVSRHPLLDDPQMHLGTWLTVDPHHFAQAVTPQLPPARPASALAGRWQRAEQHARAALGHLAGQHYFSATVAQQVAWSLPAEALWHLAGSLAIRDVGAFAGTWPRGVRISSNRGVNGIDGTVSTALGLCLGQPLPVFVLLGDVAWVHDIGALHQARQSGAQLTVVVVNNGGGGIFDGLAVAAHPTAYLPFFRTPQDLDLAAMCAGMRLWYRRADDIAGLRTALSQAAQQAGVRIIEAVVPSDARPLYAAAFAAVQNGLQATRQGEQA